LKSHIGNPHYQRLDYNFVFVKEQRFHQKPHQQYDLKRKKLLERKAERMKTDFIISI